MDTLTGYRIIRHPASILEAATRYDLEKGVFDSRVGMFGAHRRAVRCETVAT